MDVAVVGGGINGVMSAWALARRGCRVTLFERDDIMAATSSASTKLLHGGIRYLETGQFRMVREALRERRGWIERAPTLAHALRILIPLHAESRRGRWLVRAGLGLYDLLAGQARLGPTTWLNGEEVRATIPGFKPHGLRGAYAFYDGQMDDQALGFWAAEQARAAGVVFRCQCPVASVSTEGRLTTVEGVEYRFDRILNAAGPWAGRLLALSGIASGHELDLVRGSHLLLDRPLACGVLLEVPDSSRVCFVLPYQGKTLIGTTEVRQEHPESIVCSSAERDALVSLYNRYFDPPIGRSDAVQTFAGLRPLLKSHADATKATREYALERQGALVSIFGGKWTTSRALGEKAADLMLS